jgi:hypothetical protein
MLKYAHERFEVLEAEDPKMETGILCSICGEALYIAEEVVRVGVYEATWMEGKPFTYVFPNREDIQPMPEYTFHFACWEAAVHDLEEVVEDVPPAAFRNQIYPCSVCGGSIPEAMPFTAYAVSELHRSKHSKQGNSLCFSDISKYIPVCLICTARLTSTCLESWEDGVLVLLREFDKEYEDAWALNI